jgi:pyridoxine 4-dehydrogenase
MMLRSACSAPILVVGLSGTLCLSVAAGLSRKPLARHRHEGTLIPGSTFTVRISARPVRIMPDYGGCQQQLHVDCLERKSIMSTIDKAGTFPLGDRTVNRLGYGAMQLAGPGVFGPPKDHDAALAVLREAIAYGVNHIDTSDFYGPYITNQLIREALHPYPDDLVIVTKIGARRGDDGSWLPAFSPEALTEAVHDNLRHLGIDVLEVVNLRIMFSAHGPAEGSIEAPLAALAELQRQGLVRHIGLSNVTPAQISEGRRICDIVCVQNQYNLVHRADDALFDDLAREGIAYVPFFPLGGFSQLQSATLSDVAARLGATPMQVALAWLLRRAPNILLIPGTSSTAHLRENLAAADLDLPDDEILALEGIAASVGSA